MMRKIWGRVSYRLRLSMVIALFAIIPLSIFGIFYLRSERVKWEMAALSEHAKMIAVTGEKLENGILEMEQKLMYIYNSVPIRTALSKIETMGLIEGLDFITTLRETVDTITADNAYLSIRWYSYRSNHNYGGYCYSLDKLRQEFGEGDPISDKILSLETGEQFMTVRKISRLKNDIGENVCFYTKITNSNGADCILEMSMPVSQMLETADIKLPEGSLYGAQLMLNGHPQMLLLSAESEQSRQMLEIYSETEKSPGYYAYVNQVSGLEESRIICLFPEDYVADLTSENMLSFFAIVVLFVMTVLVCSYLAATMLTNKITHFLAKMNDELDTILAESSGNMIEDSDFQGIEKRIRKLIFSTKEYYSMIEQYETEKNRLELELLQMRLNPHFLYNTLTSICYQVKERDLRQRIESLIRYYRIVLSKGHLVIRIEEEIAMIREYLSLEIFAYQMQNVSYYFDVDERVKEYTIIKHLLQPIVENALEHGVRANEAGGIIRIKACLEGEDIVFEISDNGIGMTKEQIKHILTEPTRDGQNGGYGLYNVQQRIETYYGSEYGLDFKSSPGDGTCVTLRIPQKSLVNQ
ncbi:MAG: histidine kinase [Lachnospiraceae bacterium]|nr:histidine kinase [Lachnospiraceae bacterium]